MQLENDNYSEHDYEKCLINRASIGIVFVRSNKHPEAFQSLISKLLHNQKASKIKPSSMFKFSSNNGKF